MCRSTIADNEGAVGQTHIGNVDDVAVFTAQQQHSNESAALRYLVIRSCLITNSPPLLYPFPSSSSLISPFRSQLGGLGDRCELPQGDQPPNAMTNLNLKEERLWWRPIGNELAIFRNTKTLFNISRGGQMPPPCPCPCLRAPMEVRKKQESVTAMWFNYHGN